MNSLSLEECELLGDSKYRAYISQVEKALKSFEYTSEWADLISNLGKLNKVLLSHVKYPVIPKRVTIGKRLAQCLHPALPSGVHLKALETYDIIFKCIGTQRLAADLFTYSAGLFPLLGYAAMNVKPVLLALYEAHFVPLGHYIKPGLTGLLLGLLPGLEEGSEFYERTNKVLEEFCEATEPSFFYGCLWECVLSFPAIRLAAITFVLEHFNRKRTMEDQLFFMGTNIDLLVQSICQSLQDSSVLVQRHALELLLTGFPMHNGQLTRPDMVKIANATIKVVLRRDMSLNRRLYAWLLGTDANGTPLQVAQQTSEPTAPGGTGHPETMSLSSETEMGYFNTYSKEMLVQAIKNCMKEASEGTVVDGKPGVLRPFRILISLLDKPEIGSSILEDVLIDIFRYMYKECGEPGILDGSADDTSSGYSSRNSSTMSISSKLQMSRAFESKKTASPNKEEKLLSTEIIKTANLLFGAFEPYFIWDFLSRTFEAACAYCLSERNKKDSDTITVSELSKLVEFLLDKVSIETYTETQTEHLPELLAHITAALQTNCHQLSESELTASLHLCAKILSRVQPSMTPAGALSEDNISLRSSPSKAYKPKTSNIQEEYPEEEYPEVDSDGEILDVPESAYVDALKSQESELTKNNSFSDFMQYGDAMNDSFGKLKLTPRPSPSKLSKEDVKSKPQTIMQTCVQGFQKLFCTIVRARIVPDAAVAEMLFSQLHHNPQNTDTEISAKQKKAEERKQKYGRVEVESADGTKDNVVIRLLPLEHLSKDIVNAFTIASQLLVDYSCFPMYCTDQQKVLKSTLKKGSGNFPDWLQLLVTCACFVNNFQLQSSAVSTMLDLISLTHSVVDPADRETGEKDGEEEVTTPSTPEGRVAVVIVPSLSLQHLKYLNSHTYFYKIVATHLWNYLGDDTAGFHQRSVELFHLLHQLAPTPWVVEDVVGNGLLSDSKKVKIDAHKKFSILWHLLRDRQPNVTPGPLRTFDRSMFLMLDSLQSDTNPCRALTQTWLTHAIQRNDITRIMEPVLLVLLHPDTARISIQHVNIHRPKKVRLSETGIDDTDAAETKIYAISSEGGNVIYHVSNKGSKTISKKSSEELRTFALATIKPSGSAGTKVARAKGEVEMPFERVNAKDLNLRVNPFGSQNSLDKMIFEGYEPPPQLITSEIQNAKRLNAETCKKEGIFFDDNDNDNEENIENITEEIEEENERSVSPNTMARRKEAETREMVNSILEELLDKVMGKEPAPIVLQASVEDTKEESTEDLPSVTKDDNIPQIRSLRRQSRDDSVSSTVFGSLDRIDSISDSEVDGSVKAGQSDTPGIHPLHTHILLYTQKYDAQRTLYALTCLKSILTSSPKLVACALSTTSISSATSPHMMKLQNLLARHRRSVFGKNFFHEVPSDVITGYRTSMYVEILISICLYFIRSYYPNLMMSKLTDTELNGNKEVQILACEILTLLLSELVNVAKDSGRGFSTYISDLMSRCKVQKALLHCLLASVFNARLKPPGHDEILNITEAIISFNEENMDANTNETFQVKLLKLILVLILLEDQIRKARGESDSSLLLPPEWEKPKLNFQPSLSFVRYVQSRPVVYQGMLLSAVLSALKQQHLCHMHRHWVTMVTSALPYMGRALSHVVVTVVNQMCRNIELLAIRYQQDENYQGGPHQPAKVPPDHLVTLLEALTTITHYCLLDMAQQAISVGQPLPLSNSNNVVNDTATAGQIISNLFNVFNPYGNSREPSPAKEPAGQVSPVMEARRNLLSILPRILASLSSLWKSVNVCEEKQGLSGKEQAWTTLGAPKIVRQYILEFVSPISRHHGMNMMGAMAVVWNDKRQKGYASAKRVIAHVGEEQAILVDLLRAIKVLPTDTLMQTIRQVIKQPPPTNQDRNKKRTPLEVSMLQLFYACMQRTPGSHLIDTWPSLLSLLKEGMQLNLPPPAQFLMLAILNEFVQKTPSLDERKDQRDLQDVTQRLLAACSEIAGASLEQTTWLRRNLAVKPGPQIDIMENEDAPTDQEDMSPPAVSDSKSPMEDINMRQYSVQALVILAELIASLLDVIYSSEEKDKVVPFLNSIMPNVFPYLRNHSTHNTPSFRACSQILASLSSYQYTRKAWRKEAFELLLDSGFFQMDEVCVAFWRTILDNLMTHDKTTFKDLLVRVVTTPSASLNLFSSREVEFEQKAALLKRLSFTVFCSEIDQYTRYLPDIQERLTDSLKVSSIPTIHAQVFLCFRVLILRISPQHLTSLWPTVITEIVHVLMQIEQELTPDIDETSSNQKKKNSRAHLARMANLDASWAVTNGLTTQGNPTWLNLYLAACKLLDVALILPSEVIPQFQLYRWAFTGDPGADEQSSSNRNKRAKEQLQLPAFVPHVFRISKLMNQMFGPTVVIPGAGQRPLLNISHLRSLHDLHSFFHSISVAAQAPQGFSKGHIEESRGPIPKSKSAPEGLSNILQNNLKRVSGPSSSISIQEVVECLIETDFLEPLPRS